ncbi:hypothetical protein [Sphingopyxis sp.]|uniref:hypothetical protein n=1 Tax=Sphingopyxis sp. TaxID=1908224 RepID=UPI003D6C96AE
MQIDIDFDVFKALTALRQSETDSYNAVLRRLLNLSSPNAETYAAAASALLAPAVGTEQSPAQYPNALENVGGIFGLRSNAIRSSENALGALSGRYTFGIWLGNAHFPEGTQFRANYKGQTYFAEVRDSKWLGQDGIPRTSPSEAASAITGNNVNGWRFWFVQMPDDAGWRRLDEFKS